MENEDLMKNLEKIELPEIEIQSHRAKLRMALLNSDYFKKTNFFEVFKKYFIFATPALVLLAIFGITVISPKLNEAKAFTIAGNNSEIKRLIEENNMVLSDVKIDGNKAYVLLNPIEETKQTIGGDSIIKVQKTTEKENKAENIEGAIIEINLGKKEVVEIKPIKGDDIVPLADKEKESAKEIADSEEVIKNIISQEAHVEKVQSVLPQVNLTEKDHKIEVVAQPVSEKEANVHYELDGKKWVVKVNLDKKKVEGIKYSAEDSAENHN
jgi:hypothetical protein